MAVCPAFDPTGPYVSQVVDFVDCHSLALGAAGYQALGPGTSFGMALSGLLTIYVALIGYRLLLGGQITLREGVWSALRLGFVVALATQWAAYQPLVYNVITAGPGDLAARVLAPGGLGGNAPAQLIDRVQGVHAALVELIPPPPPEIAVPLTPASPTTATPVPATAPPALSQESRAALVSADHLLVGAALAGTLSVRVVTALLLALGPLFIGCLLFDATRGLFVGWVRILAGAALAGIAAALVIALELAVIEPQVEALRGLLDTSQPAGTLPQDMLATCSCFALVMLAALIALARTTAAFRLPAIAQRAVEQVLAPRDPAMSGDRAFAGAAVPLREPSQRSRAEQVADAARATERRDARTGGSAAASVPALAPREPAARLQQMVMSPLPLGQSGRRTARRMSPTAGRRDERL
jgi:type IV secretion system protein VirB6